MPRPVLINDNFYHIYNRGVDKRKVFMDEKDYFRFIHDLFEFNDKNITINVNFYAKRNYRRNYGSRIPIVLAQRKARELLVDIVCYCLMPNHYHLFLRQRMDGGISKFLQKLGTGYTNYFNLKHERSGVLFQGKFKAVSIETDVQFTHLSRYIHLNPAELVESNWKEQGIKNWQEVKKHLESYRWSSYSDYIGKKNFPSLINKKVLSDYFDNRNEYRKFVENWVLKDAELLNGLAIE